MKSSREHPGWGGRREGGGRPSKWGCKTVVIRVPEHMVGEIAAYIERKLKEKAQP